MVGLLIVALTGMLNDFQVVQRSVLAKQLIGVCGTPEEKGKCGRGRVHCETEGVMRK